MSPIRKRYLTQFLIILAFIICSIAFLLYTISNQINNTLEDRYYKKLNVTKNTLKKNIENYFESKSNLIITLSENKDIKKSLNDFSKGFKQLNNEYTKSIDHDKLTGLINEHTKKVVYDVPNASNKKEFKDYIPSNKNGAILQNLYILENKFEIGEKDKLFSSKYNLSYDISHQKYHQNFLNILKRHKFYDIFLIDNKANIVYSVFKELDLGTNLKNGIYSKSSLAKAYKKALKKETLCFSDFKPYEPSYNKPAAFFAIPIKENGKINGAIAFQISIDEINSIATFNSNWEEIGLGKSGEAYLVGDDYLMRSDSRFKSNIDNKIVKKLDTTIGVLNVDSNLVKTALNGKDEYGKFIDYRGIDVLSSFTPISVFDHIWALVVEIDSDEVNKEIDKTINFIILVSITIIFLLMIVLWFIVLNTIIKPIENFEKKLEIKVNEQTKELYELNKSLKEKVEDQISQMRQKDKILLHQSRMAAIGEMTHNIAHQWRQPLAVISMHSNTMELEIEFDENTTKEEKIEHLEEINKQAKYLSQTIDDFIGFFNSDPSFKEETSLLNILEKTEDLIKGGFEENQIKLSIITNEDIDLKVNINQLVQVFLNMFNNCKDAIVANEKEKRFVFVTLSKEDNKAVVRIKDSGGGIKEDILEKIFDPYTTTKHSYVGTGIGLYMSYQLITKVYNGTMEVNNIEYEFEGDKLKGAEFTVSIPL